MNTNNEISKDLAVNFLLQPLKPLFDDPEITEICINEPNVVFYEKNGKWGSTQYKELTYDNLLRLGIAVAKFANTDFCETSPIVSAVLPNGERSQFVMPPACKDNTISVTIRKPSFHVRKMSEYEESGFFNHVTAADKVNVEDKELLELQKQFESEEDSTKAAELRSEFLEKAVTFGKNIVIAGETGSGKTTFMKTLMQSIPTDQRLITIEDVPELMWGLPNHHNVVNLLYPSEAGTNSTITAASLMRSCLRMKPDRILLAELRGGETYDFLNVCLSGHSGTITSCHAGSTKGVFEYLALKVMQSEIGKSLPYNVIQKLLHLVIDVVVCVHNDKVHGRGRHITEMWFDPTSKYAEIENAR